MILYLLEQVPEGEPVSVEIDGCHWSLTARDLDTAEVDGISFTCVSYSWGTGREPSPFHPNFEVSDRTIPALTAGARHHPSYIWIDAFCVPQEAQEREQCLRSMGYIYSKAKEVVVVLSIQSYSALKQMSASDRVDLAGLAALESEDWVSRAWTYQEAVNSRELYITCGGLDAPNVDGGHFMNCVGFSLSLLEKSAPESNVNYQYPRLDAFQDLIADFWIAGYQERSALQVMSNMDRRTQSRTEDHFYAMMGAISADHTSFQNSLDPCEAFMVLCEKKGDYSFIYSAAERDTSPIRPWRPISGDLPSILPLHSWGEGQSAHEVSGSLYLDQMIVLDQAPINTVGRTSVEDHIAHKNRQAVHSDTQLQELAYAYLQSLSFRGSAQCLSTTHGFFFPFNQISNDAEVSIMVSTQVRWKLGAPGLASYRKGATKSYTPGVFFGSVNASATTSVKVS